MCDFICYFNQQVPRLKITGARPPGKKLRGPLPPLPRSSYFPDSKLQFTPEYLSTVDPVIASATI